MAPGGIYQAQLFLAVSTRYSTCNVHMTANGQSLPETRYDYDDSGRLVQLTVPTQLGHRDTVEARWHGRIQVQSRYADTARIMKMVCNGQPVAVGPDGVGHIRFRAPMQPGPAVRTASVRVIQNGRDTVFRVRVPYRVAAR